MYYTVTIQFSKNMQFMHCNHHKFIFANEQMMFGGCRNFKTIQFGVGFLENVKIQVEAIKCIIQPVYNFLKMCNLCIPITINLYLQMSRFCLEVVSISKHLVWCHIFGKCQNLGGSDEMYYAATVQFSKNVQFVHSNHHQFYFCQ